MSKVKSIANVSSIEDLGLSKRLEVNFRRYDARELVSLARRGGLTELYGIGLKRAAMITDALQDAGWLLVESPRSKAFRTFLRAVGTLPKDFSDGEYESWEEFTDEQMFRITDALSTLTPRESLVVKAHFGLDSEPPMRLEDIGAMCNCTRERIRQIEAKAFRKIHHPCRQRLLKACVAGLDEVEDAPQE